MSGCSNDPSNNPSLADELVPDWAGIAREVFGKDDPSTIRKCRNLADRHGMPVHRKGRYCWGFKSQLARWARGETDDAANGTQPAAEQGAGQ